MRRCKYYFRYAWWYKEYPSNNIKIASAMICNYKHTKDTFDNFVSCLFGKCSLYTPVEVDPYWKDIIDETNRRLSLKK